MSTVRVLLFHIPRNSSTCNGAVITSILFCYINSAYYTVVMETPRTVAVLSGKNHWLTYSQARTLLSVSSSQLLLQSFVIALESLWPFMSNKKRVKILFFYPEAIVTDRATNANTRWETKFIAVCSSVLWYTRAVDFSHSATLVLSKVYRRRFHPQVYSHKQPLDI